MPGAICYLRRRLIANRRSSSAGHSASYHLLLTFLASVAALQYHLGQLKAKLAKLRTQLQEGTSKARSGSNPWCLLAPLLFGGGV